MSTPRLRSTDDTHFDTDVSSAPLVLVKFTGAWCPPCRALEPTLEALVRDREELLVLTLDVDTQQAVAERFGVRAVPTLLLFREGRPVDQRVGAVSRSSLDAMLRS